jgi:hypothetical protein
VGIPFTGADISGLLTMGIQRGTSFDISSASIPHWVGFTSDKAGGGLATHTWQEQVPPTYFKLAGADTGMLAAKVGSTFSGQIAVTGGTTVIPSSQDPQRKIGIFLDFTKYQPDATQFTLRYYASDASGGYGTVKDVESPRFWQQLDSDQPVDSTLITNVSHLGNFTVDEGTNGVLDTFGFYWTGTQAIRLYACGGFISY